MLWQQRRSKPPAFVSSASKVNCPPKPEKSLPIIYCKSYKPVLTEVRPRCRSRSATSERNNDQQTRRQDRRHHWRDRRDWVGYCKTFRQGGCLCLHHGPPPEGTRRGREGNRHQRFWSSGRRCPIG